MKRNQLGSKKAKNLVYIHSTLCFISRKDPRYEEGPFKIWDKYTYDAICVDEERQLEGFVKIPPITIDKEKPILESDDYLESMLTEDLSDNNDMEDETGLADVA